VSGFVRLIFIFLFLQRMIQRRTNRRINQQQSSSQGSFMRFSRTMVGLGGLLALFVVSKVQAQACQADVFGTQQECRGREATPWVWVAGGFAHSSGPECNSVGAVGGQCETEGEAWDVYFQKVRDTFLSSLCSGPSLTPRATDLGGNPMPYFGYSFGQLSAQNFAYDSTYGYRSQGSPNCNLIVTPVGSKGSRNFFCPAGFSPSENKCVRFKPEACPAGNPIQCASGEKVQHDVDFSSPGGLAFSRYYSSSGFYYPATAPAPLNSLGPKWRHSWEQQVVEETVNGMSIAHVVDPSGDYRHFRKVGTAWQGRTDKPEKLTEVVNGVGVRTAWIFDDAQNTRHQFNELGKLVSKTTSSGDIFTLTYSDASTPISIAPIPGLLIRVANEKGRSLDLVYNNNSKLLQVKAPDGQNYDYAYNQSRHLSRMSSPSGARNYLYNESTLINSSSYGALLTGIVDERGQRFLSNRFDVFGRATEQWHGDTLGANRLQLSYFSSRYAYIEFAFGCCRAAGSPPVC
jgi:YD repeat-containing protein